VLGLRVWGIGIRAGGWVSDGPLQLMPSAQVRETGGLGFKGLGLGGFRLGVWTTAPHA
jgi:hypothetical protein